LFGDCGGMTPSVQAVSSVTVKVRAFSLGRRTRIRQIIRHKKGANQ
jgi:hypothetical protein